jgi:hypothetical protein
MSESDIVERVESDVQTELSRLGSSKSLYAATAGDLDDDSVLAAFCDGLSHAARRVGDWADIDSSGPWADATERLEAAAATVAEELDGHETGEVPAGMAALPAVDDSDDRAGALLGWALVTERTVTQVTGYFTGQADPTTASLIREFGDDVEAVRDAAADTIADEDAAVDAATAVVESAYDAYFETLEELGVNPKPIC